MDENDRGGVEFDGPAKDGAGIEGDLAHGSMLQLFVRDQVAGGVEEENAERLLGQRAHRRFEIIKQLRVCRIESAIRKLGAHGLQGGGPGGDDDLRDRTAFSQRSRERFRGLGKKASERPML